MTWLLVVPFAFNMQDHMGNREDNLLSVLDSPVQFIEELFQFDMMDIRSMLQSFIIGNLALKTSKLVFFKNSKGLGITTDNFTNKHIFFYHASTLSYVLNIKSPLAKGNLGRFALVCRSKIPP